jgi:hypothetical protein
MTATIHKLPDKELYRKADDVLRQYQYICEAQYYLIIAMAELQLIIWGVRK